MFLSAQDRAKAKALKSPVYLAALKLARQLQKNTTAAYNAEEVLSASMCALHQADGKYQLEAELKNLAEIVAKYTNSSSPAVRTLVSFRFFVGTRAIGATLAAGTVAGVVLLGLDFVTRAPVASVAATMEDLRQFQAEEWAGPTIAAALALAQAAVCADCSPLPMLPVWRGRRPRPQLPPWDTRQAAPLLFLANRERSTP